MTVRFLAVDLDGDGAHPAAWRQSGRPPGAGLTAAALRASVTGAETAGFDLVTFEDAPLPPGGVDPVGRLEAGTRAAFASTLTRSVGLAPVLHTTTTEPFHLATQLASLDHASNGRAAWLVGAAADPASLATVGAPALDADARRQEVVDVITTARRLWDSWQDDAVIKDLPTGRYLDAGRVHHIDFTGATFSVKGPLITPRPPQGQVVVIAPSPLEVDEHADIVLVVADDLDAVRDRAHRARTAGVPLVFADLEVALDTPSATAAERVAALDESAPWTPTGRLRHVGPGAGLTELLAALGEVVDGVRLLPAVQAVDLPLISRPEPVAGTLRSRLGLPHPANPFATQV